MMVTHIVLTSVVMLCLTTTGQLTSSQLQNLFAPFREVGHRLEAEGAQRETAVDDGRSTEELLLLLRENPYQRHDSPILQVLAARGEAVVPRLLKEFADAKDYHRDNIIRILSQIKSPARDEAFLVALQVAAPDAVSLEQSHILSMARALANDDVKEAVAVIRRFTGPVSKPSLRFGARQALEKLGHRELQAIQDTDVRLGDKLNVDEFSSQMDVLRTLVGYEAIPYPMTIESGRKVEDRTILYGKFENGTWEIKIGNPVGGNIPFYFSTYSGPLEAWGSAGVLERIGNEWRLAYWRQLWVS